jgi:hypothetical protein
LINPANFSFFWPLWGKKYFRFAEGPAKAGLKPENTNQPQEDV